MSTKQERVFQDMSKVLPEGWITVSFGELNTYKSSNVDPSNYPDEIFELYSVPIFPVGKPEYLVGNDIGSTKHLVDIDDVLLCKINPRINRVWSIAKDSTYRQIASSEWIVFRQPYTNSQFIKYQLSENSFRELLCADVTGVGGSLTRAQPKNVSILPIKLPPLAEQQEIATRLDDLLAQVDAIKARLDAIPAILKRFRQAVLAAAVSGKLTEDWRESCEDIEEWQKQRIINIVSNIEAGKNLQCEERPPKENEYGIIKISAVTWGFYDELESKTLPNPIEFIEQRRIAVGDFLISRANTLELLGSPVIVEKTSKNLMLSDKVWRLIMSEEDKPWLKIFLRSYFGRKELEMRSTGNQLSMRNIGQKAFLDIEVPKPSSEEQAEIVNRVEQLFAFADQIEQQVQATQTRVNQLTQAILAKAFKGELTAAWRAAHPELISGEHSAEALLEKIKVSQIPAKPKRGKTTNNTLSLLPD